MSNARFQTCGLLEDTHYTIFSRRVVMPDGVGPAAGTKFILSVEYVIFYPLVDMDLNCLRSTRRGREDHRSSQE